MEYLWAPWRMSYIMSTEKPGGCIFCDKPLEDRDEENGILYRGRHCFVILNAYPYNPGHLMIVPYAHEGSVLALEPQVSMEMMELTVRAMRILTDASSPEGINVGMNQGQAAGAGIAEHVHQHVVPRWLGDTNFMTSIAATKVLPEMVSDSYRRLAPLFAGPTD